MIRIFSVLGRISNWPTVWSNCLAAWLLGGGGSSARLAILGLGATILYTSGPVLNDAFDTDFDRAYRPERPIPSGKISRRHVWILGSALLGLGWLVIASLGLSPALVASGLVVMIVLYNAVHKYTPLAPVLMGGCRFLLYIVAALSAQPILNTRLLWRALALALYVAGLSCLARHESTPATIPRWPIALVLAPVPIALLTSDGGQLPLLILPGVLFVSWLSWSLAQAWLSPTDSRFTFHVSRSTHHASLPRAVAALLAGIVLVDWLAAGAGSTTALVFVALFVLANVLQRIVPAT